MKHLKKIVTLIHVLISCLSSQINQSTGVKENDGLIISVSPYSLQSYDIEQLSDTITAKMSYLHNYWTPQENISLPNAQVFRVYLSIADSIVLIVSEPKRNFISEPLRKYLPKGYYTVKVDNYRFPQSGIFYLTAKFCDSTFTRKMYFIK